ncbi:MAG: hypothetical protein J1E65_07520 [Lachnospiraceae bacterium]|nr:hypothetical protein [Lachnospiraceae bacterium]
MKKNIYIGLLVWLVLSVVLLCLLPWVAFAFVKSDEGIVALNGMFIIIYYIYFIAVGIFAGINFKKMWSLPIITYIMFVYSMFIFFDYARSPYDPLQIATDEGALSVFVVGIIAMLVTALIKLAIKLANSL